jgi:hypothetical protein
MSSKPVLKDTLYALTTRIFRCQGLAPSSERHDRVGGHDVFFWLAFLSVGAAWYFLLFEPTCQRNNMLAGRLAVLRAQAKAEQQEQARLKLGIQSLLHGQPDAWERAARAQLGWLEPGEVTDRDTWRREHPQWASIAQAPPPPRVGRYAFLTMRLYVPRPLSIPAPGRSAPGGVSRTPQSVPPYVAPPSAPLVAQALPGAGHIERRAPTPPGVVPSSSLGHTP